MIKHDQTLVINLIYELISKVKIDRLLFTPEISLETTLKILDDLSKILKDLNDKESSVKD